MNLHQAQSNVLMSPWWGWTWFWSWRMFHCLLGPSAVLWTWRPGSKLKSELVGASKLVRILLFDKLQTISPTACLSGYRHSIGLDPSSAESPSSGALHWMHQSPALFCLTWGNPVLAVGNWIVSPFFPLCLVLLLLQLHVPPPRPWVTSSNRTPVLCLHSSPVWRWECSGQSFL